MCKDLQTSSQEINIPSNKKLPFFFFLFEGHIAYLLFILLVHRWVYSSYLNDISLLIWFKNHSYYVIKSMMTASKQKKKPKKCEAES